MNFLRFALFGLLIVAGSMFVNIVPVPARKAGNTEAVFISSSG